MNKTDHREMPESELPPKNKDATRAQRRNKTRVDSRGRPTREQVAVGGEVRPEPFGEI